MPFGFGSGEQPLTCLLIQYTFLTSFVNLAEVMNHVILSHSRCLMGSKIPFQARRNCKSREKDMFSVSHRT